MKKTTTKIISAIAVALCVAALCGTLCACSGQGGKSTGSATNPSPSSTSATPKSPQQCLTEATGPYASGMHNVQVTVQGYDPFIIQLDANAAPVTVSHFCDEVQKGTYNGNSFHRIVQEFCLQGGDPTGTGTGSGDASVIGEFSSNGVKNALADDFKRGTIAMARTSAPNSASLQWFITLSDKAASSLNGKYAAFGTVNEAGMAVVDRIVDDYLPAATGNSGTIPSKDAQPVIESITIIS